MNITYAKLVTPNFTFESVALTEEEALSLLENAWAQHFEEHGQPDSMLSFDAVLDTASSGSMGYSLETRNFTPGAVYRDGKALAVSSHTSEPA